MHAHSQSEIKTQMHVLFPEDRHNNQSIQKRIAPQGLWKLAVKTSSLQHPR